MTMYFESLLKFFLVIFLSLSIFGCSEKANQKEDIFRITAIPDEDPTELARKAEPLVKYLSSVIGKEVVYYPVTDYASAVEAIVNKKVEMAWFGGFTYVQAKKRSNGEVIPIIQRVEDQGFKSVFISSDKSIKSLSDLKGKDEMLTFCARKIKQNDEIIGSASSVARWGKWQQFRVHFSTIS